MRDVVCKLTGNLFQPPRRNKRFPAARVHPRIAWAKLRNGATIASNK
jgi:hypothetical protein